MLRDGRRGGYIPFERILLAFVISLSASTPAFAIFLGLPVAPLLPFAMLWLGLRRMHLSTEGHEQAGEPGHISGTASA